MPRERPDRVRSIARRHGIAPEYVDAAGVTRTVPRSTLVALLEARGFALGAPGTPSDGSGAERSFPSVLDLGPRGSTRLAVAPSLEGRPLRSVRLGSEEGRRARALPYRGDGFVRIGPGVPFGVHRLSLDYGGRVRTVALVRAPARLRRRAGPRRWGLFAPIHALRTASTWGCGDLSALEMLGSWAAPLGASALFTLPILPQFLDRPYDPSPYRPVSRRFWNEVYLDPTRTPEFRSSGRARRFVGSAEFRRQVELLERRPYADLRAVARLKRTVVERMIAEFPSAPARRRRAFERFVARTEGLEEYARFRGARAPDPDREAEYHRFVQWLVEEQLRGVAHRLAGRGLGLGLDLPLGTHPRGFDAFRESSLLPRGVHVGSPPDPGVPGGQDWGFAPWDPERLRSAGYGPFAAALRHQLSVGALLRLDHVLGLHRLFWIPAGRPPRDGAYVLQPVRDLYRVVLAEAAATGATIVGEDLGTVPPELRPALARRGLLAMYVAELEWDGSGPPRRIPAEAMVALNTHDHPPFAGYWSERGRVGHPPFAARTFPPPGTSWGRAFRTATLRLARSRARLQLVSLEDLWGETRPQNVPGRRGRYFTRRCRKRVEELETDGAVAELLSTVHALRQGRYDR